MNMTDPQRVAKIDAGLLRGVREDGVTIFRGVPFASPPVGKLRFRSPQPLEHWDGVRDATRPQHASFQINFANMANISQIAAQIDPGVPGVIAGPKSVFATYCHNDVSEDCLYLDIWIPDAARQRPVPVFVYYHGGANMVSSGSFELERGANLAREGEMIVVRPNYRLGALGWVHFGLIADDLSEAINLGVQDQLAALKWVHANIAAFGGDPDNITIGGESAGATAVSHLLGNTDAHRYFRRAILQSFSPFNPWCTQQRAEAEFVARKYLELLEINNVRDLHTIDPARLVAVQNLLARWFGPDEHVAWRALGAVAGKVGVPHLPGVALSESPIAKQDLEVMIGFAKDEWLFFRGHTDTVSHGSEDAVLAVVSQLFGEDRARSIYATYRTQYPLHTPGRILSDIMSFEYFKLPSLAMARNLCGQNIPVYAFQFSYDLPGLGGSLKAPHTGDMPFLFRNFEMCDLAAWPFFEGVGESDLRSHQEKIGKIASAFGKYYASFIHDGDPGPGWARFDADRSTILRLGDTIEAVPGMLQAELSLYEKEGFGRVSALEEALVGNVRASLAPISADAM